ncbi:site-specific integrase [Mycobacterium sp. CBMA293]|nr:site-specific integrase [Mycolicibacterium sp. CBMA 360]MUL58923.1 site-specific integrase [Mycolicibacterium sp. CBMA 335]MUL69317.1 site-specific integrase [Mycolicibacterium sp. CBMA 311]MUL94281.1 site-specific integrase [Mycolicibacterium sp. CBMA 230]MUM04053.1 site-specific integrase [Mycolicibacterium sp. CBMA 213]MUM11410.1 site-specific integrase [Mycolicibacterium sp. CBMA 293]MUM30742.1 site-specific integrase [Mycolicibacterium sp. CBMA 361]
MVQKRNRRAGVEDRWTKTIQNADGNTQAVPSANHGKGMRWRARYVDESGKEHAKGFTRKVDATKWLDDITSTIVTGTYVAPGAGAVTVGQMHTQWLKTQAHVKDSTKAARASAWTVHVRASWEATAVAEVQTSAVRAWVTALAEAGSEAPTIENALGVLRMVLGLAVEDRRLPRNPCDGVKAPRRKHSARAYLTHQQVDQLATTVARDGLVIRFLAYTGLRYGEMAALKVRDFDMLRRRVNIRESVTEVSGKLTWSTPKNHERRSVPFPRFLLAELASRMEGKGRDDLVFSAPAGGVLRIATFRTRVFNPAVDKLRGIEQGEPTTDWPRPTLHDLRHTAASLAISAGANVKAVQTMLGHKSAALTLDTYADLFPDDLEAVADAFDAAVGALAKTAADALRTEGEPAS